MRANQGARLGAGAYGQATQCKVQSVKCAGLSAARAVGLSAVGRGRHRVAVVPSGSSAAVAADDRTIAPAYDRKPTH